MKQVVVRALLGGLATAIVFALLSLIAGPVQLSYPFKIVSPNYSETGVAHIDLGPLVTRLAMLMGASTGAIIGALTALVPARGRALDSSGE